MMNLMKNKGCMRMDARGLTVHFHSNVRPASMSEHPFDKSKYVALSGTSRGTELL